MSGPRTPSLASLAEECEAHARHFDDLFGREASDRFREIANALRRIDYDLALHVERPRPAVRKTDPDTSKTAFERVSKDGRLRKTHRSICRYLATMFSADKTSEQIAHGIGRRHAACVSSRMTELRRAGYVAAVGVEDGQTTYRITSRGRAAISGDAA